MNAPILEATLIPVAPNAAISPTTHEGTCAIDAEAIVVQTIESPWGAFTFACVSMGNPHAVCFLDKEAFAALPDECFTDTPRSLKTLDVARAGSFFEAHEFFPEKTNVDSPWLKMHATSRCAYSNVAAARLTLAARVPARPKLPHTFRHDRTSCRPASAWRRASYRP